MHVREPLIHTVPLLDLRPTQMTVGQREVDAKRAAWRERQALKQASFLGDHMIPVLRGPHNHAYIIDHHHLARALHEEGVEHVLITVVADLSGLDKTMFWTVCDHKGWAHPYDEQGVRQKFDKIPKSITDLKDDPYRSLAGELRRAGAFAKDVTPFSEFLWADFLRRRVKDDLSQGPTKKILKAAFDLARSETARYLPGWCGPAPY